ncbi:MAG TPA: M28 family peptidase, partial [Chitinophagaceae bacterium]|nr:M28 family peptidase [Chitinophagaceae bacterium]
MMQRRRRHATFLAMACLNILAATAQTEVPFLKEQAAILAAPGMYGRGYVNGGGDKAARYISDQFREIGLKTFRNANGYYQPYTFPVNTFPGIVSLRIGHKKLKPGKDFLVHAASGSVTIRNEKLVTIDLAGIKDTITWQSVRKRFIPGGAYLLTNIDTLVKYENLSNRKLASLFPNSGVFILPTHKKLTWLATTDTVGATIFFVADSVLPEKSQRVSAKVQSRFVPAFPTQNILGFVPGTQQPDSFIVFSAHYDHLGMMGRKAIFPGASDNASGVAVLLSLARYYTAHPASYSIAFMSFSGEEAGLIGSGYYVTSPVFPLKKIRFLVNLDIAGDATRGITVVNGSAPETAGEYALLEKINRQNDYLPSITARGQAKNSDHYQFSEKGVPA